MKLQIKDKTTYVAYYNYFFVGPYRLLCLIFLPTLNIEKTWDPPWQFLTVNRECVGDGIMRSHTSWYHKKYIAFMCYLLRITRWYI